MNIDLCQFYLHTYTVASDSAKSIISVTKERVLDNLTKFFLAVELGLELDS